jgi:hypothetical protein
VFQKSAGYRDPTTGSWVEGSETEITVKGNEQPMSMQEKQMLPDAFRSKDVRYFFALKELNILDEATGQEPDEILIDGDRFEVIEKQSFQMGVRRHYEYKVTRVEQSAGSGGS